MSQTCRYLVGGIQNFHLHNFKTNIFMTLYATEINYERIYMDNPQTCSIGIFKSYDKLLLINSSQWSHWTCFRLDKFFQFVFLRLTRHFSAACAFKRELLNINFFRSTLYWFISRQTTFGITTVFNSGTCRDHCFLHVLSRTFEYFADSFCLLVRKFDGFERKM